MHPCTPGGVSLLARLLDDSPLDPIWECTSRHADIQGPLREIRPNLKLPSNFVCPIYIFIKLSRLVWLCCIVLRRMLARVRVYHVLVRAFARPPLDLGKLPYSPLSPTRPLFTHVYIREITFPLPCDLFSFSRHTTRLLLYLSLHLSSSSNIYIYINTRPTKYEYIIIFPTSSTIL